MAGIGFELKKAVSERRGLFAATVRAYGYAGVVCTGPTPARYRAAGRRFMYLCDTDRC